MEDPVSVSSENPSLVSQVWQPRHLNLQRTTLSRGVWSHGVLQPVGTYPNRMKPSSDREQRRTRPSSGEITPTHWNTDRAEAGLLL